MRDDPDLLELLACPACAGALSVAAVSGRASDGHLLEGELRCDGCDACFAIRAGVPRLALDAVTDVSRETAERFAYQWQRAGASLGEGLFTAPETFLEFIEPVSREEFTDRLVLDAGCGAGRFTRLAAEFGARAVVGADLSESVLVAFETTRHLANVLIVQAPLERLPVMKSFDYAFSIGVLHHTDNPASSFAAVARCVRPGGRMSVWVYSREGNEWIVRFVDRLRKNLTSRMPPAVLRAAAYVLALPLLLLVRLVYAPVGRYAALAGLRRRLFYYDYLHFLSRFRYADIALIAFDHLHPALAEYISRQELEGWFADCAMPAPVITARTGNSWRGLGLRSLGAAQSRLDGTAL